MSDTHTLYADSLIVGYKGNNLPPPDVIISDQIGITITRRPSWHKTFLDMLEIIKHRSQCLKLQTAAMIVKGTQIISFGYNGTFTGCTECYNYWNNYHYEHRSQLNTCSFNSWLLTDEFKIAHREWSKANEVHAESNAMKWVSKYDIDEKCAMYTLMSPCESCAKEIIAHGLKLVYYKYDYKHGQKALETLRENNVICCKVLQ